MKSTFIHRIIKKIDKELSGPVSIFPDQFLYGQREIYFYYSGIDSSSILLGTTEHGWAVKSSKPVRKIPFGHFPHFSWSQERKERTNDTKNIIPVGSAFLYLTNIIKSKTSQKFPQSIETNSRVLFFPAHGNEYEFHNHETQIKLFKKKFNPKESTVCLYWSDFINPQVRSVYQNCGFYDLVTAGFPGQMQDSGLGYSATKLAFSPIGGRPTFLINLIELLTQHKDIVVGAFSTVCFYAAALEKPLYLLTEYMRTNLQVSDDLSPRKYQDVDYYKDSERFVSQSLQVAFENVDFCSLEFRNLAFQELGSGCIKDPLELKKIFEPNVIKLIDSFSMRNFEIHLEKFIKSIA